MQMRQLIEFIPVAAVIHMAIPVTDIGQMIMARNNTGITRTLADEK